MVSGQGAAPFQHAARVSLDAETQRRWHTMLSFCAIQKKRDHRLAIDWRSLLCEYSYLVDPSSSHMLVSKDKPCMSKYKFLYCETANDSLNQLSFIWLYLIYYLENRGNSRANTCEKSRLLEGMYLLDSKPIRVPPGCLVIHNNCSNCAGAMFHSNFCPINCGW